MCSVPYNVCTYRWLSVNQVVSYTRTVYLTMTLYEFHDRQFLITTNFLGSRPSVTEKVMRRTSYAGEMTPELKGKNKGIYESTEMPIQMINQSSAARPSAQVRHFRAKALQEDDSSDPRESCEGGDEAGEQVVRQHRSRRQRAQTWQLPGGGGGGSRRDSRGEGQRGRHFRAVACGERGRAGSQAQAAAAEGAEQEDVQVQEDEKRGSQIELI